MVLHNTRLHSTLEKILDLGWSILIHPLYSPDLAVNDFHFYHLQKLSNENFFPKSGENICEKLELENVWIILEESKSYPINGKYTTDQNNFIKLFMNKLHKTEDIFVYIKRQRIGVMRFTFHNIPKRIFWNKEWK